MRECTPVLGQKRSEPGRAASYRVSCVHTFGRLLGFLRPYKRGVVWSLLLAALAMVCTVAIPWLTGRAVDQISDGDRDGLRKLALAVIGVALAAARALDHAPARVRPVSLAIEYDLRTLLYAHLQKLELGFFAGQQTGQLMSRATVDLSSVRFFLGYGLVFILQSGLTIVLASIAMFWLSPGLAALALIPVPFVVVVATRTGTARGRRCRRSSSGSPRSPRTSRRTSPASAWSRRSRPSRASSSASAARSRASSTSRCSRPACARSTTRSWPSCPTSAWP